MITPNTPWNPKYTSADFPEPYKNMKTHPFDPRYPNTNQTKNCWQNYVDFQRCSKVRGEDYEACQYFKKAYRILCPNEWIEKFDDQIAAGTFPMKI
ncbi:hypothetical protein PV325_013526 [Microctonus aethiopoides]|uniref:Cytochrome c oxidase subunit 6B1 n=1 Tax=Microctonus aethiopoides TaxID=144406 RepID=A0AA39FIP6_9HYME|nr:hypothetical protein PV325_013526 [Microctonus aethiopoides]KAK0097340.1 hypothetical protein PV326_002375 [Microctonus aethiopoides]KAK0170218.1 hypothetical protein PV328_010805 [Microctonus aethiopoides]